MTETESKAALEAWLVENTPQGELTGVAHDQDIVTGRILDSLRFLDLVLLIEELSGSPVDIEAAELDDFRTIDRIWERFLQPA